MHAHAAAVLEQTGGPEVADLLSMHYEAARRFGPAWTYSRLAGDQARARFANVEAATFYQRALVATASVPQPDEDVAEVAESLGDVSDLLGRLGEALAAYKVARRRLGDGDAATRACSARPARSRSAPGATAPRSVGTAAASSRRGSFPGHPRSLQAMLAMASVRYWQGRFEECIVWCREAISEAERAGDRNVLGHAYHLLHLTYTDLNARSPLRSARTGRCRSTKNSTTRWDRATR